MWAPGRSLPLQERDQVGGQTGADRNEAGLAAFAQTNEYLSRARFKEEIGDAERAEFADPQTPVLSRVSMMGSVADRVPVTATALDLYGAPQNVKPVEHPKTYQALRSKQLEP